MRHGRHVHPYILRNVLLQEDARHSFSPFGGCLPNYRQQPWLPHSSEHCQPNHCLTKLGILPVLWALMTCCQATSAVA